VLYGLKISNEARKYGCVAVVAVDSLGSQAVVGVDRVAILQRYCILKEYSKLEQ